MNIQIHTKNLIHSHYGEYDSLFSLKKKDVQRVLGFVVGLHIIIFLLAILGLPDFKFARRPDITIEIGAAPMVSDGPSSNTKPSNQPTSKDQAKEKTPPVVKDNDGQLSRPQTTSNAASTAPSSSGGPASAPTTDADYKASYLQNPKPPYPPLAFRMRVEGKVVLLTEVLSDGRAGNVSIAQSSGHELLDQSALETVKKWKFTPARKDGVIVTQAVRIPITFSLKNR